MDLPKIRYAATLARVQNFTKAARELNITQSALSRSIQSLEAECQVQLFDRTRGTVTLTQAGREFARHAEALLRSEAKLRSVVESVFAGDGGRITIGATPFAARVLLTPILAERVGRPNFHAEVVTGTASEIMRMLTQERIDLCICAGEEAARNSPLISRPIVRLPLAVLARKEHPLSKLETLCQSDVERYPVIRSTPYSSRDILPGGSPVPDIMPAVTIEDFGALIWIAAHSDAVWITSPHAARGALARGDLIEMPITWLPEPPYFKLMAYTLRKTTISPVARSMLESMIALGARIAFDTQ
jgi:DNA-binding transcriptional LysR family regulator